MEVDIMDEAGTVRPMAEGAAVGLGLPRFRYRVRIDANPVNPVTGASDRINQPVLETPFLDDITFLWQPASGPRIRTWARE